MTPRTDEQARIFAALVDDLLADREPVVPPAAAAAFTPQELAETLSTVRFLKGLLRPSRPHPEFAPTLREQLAARVRAERVQALAATPPLGELVARWRERLGLSDAALADRAGLAAETIRGVETDVVAPLSVEPERLRALVRALGIPAAEALAAARRSAERWLERLVNQRMLEQRPLAFTFALGESADEAERDEATIRRAQAERVAAYLAQLERLLE